MAGNSNSRIPLENPCTDFSVLGRAECKPVNSSNSTINISSGKLIGKSDIAMKKLFCYNHSLSHPQKSDKKEYIHPLNATLLLLIANQRKPQAKTKTKTEIKSTPRD